MRRNILVQGLGCAETGARVVLSELLQHAPPGPRYWVLCTSVSARQMTGKTFGRLKPGVFVIGLSHAVFGRWLRLGVEAVVALAGLLRLVSGVVNLSHYGLCLGGRYTLYIHSPLLMDRGAGAGWKDGDPNRLKRMLLNTCLRRADLVVLQTPQMQAQLQAYCAALSLPPPRHLVMRPRVEIPAAAEIRRRFPRQLFYPTSRFSHKRAELATAGARLAAASHPGLGLAITVDDDKSGAGEAVAFLGPVPRAEVFAWLRGSDAMLFTSERETLGLPLLEAMELGVPVVAPRLSYAVEILGDAGCYFDAPTPESVAQAIETCLANAGDYRSRIALRAAEIRAHSAGWAEHWAVLTRPFAR